MNSSEKQWFVMRDLKRRTSNTLAIHQLAKAGLEVFTPMTQMVMKIGGRMQRREVPVIQDLLFVHESKAKLDSVVESIPSLQYRYQRGNTIDNPTTVRKEEMERFMFAVNQTETPVFYMPGEITDAMYGKEVHIVGGALNGYEGRLLAVKGMRKRRLIVELPGLMAAAVEVEPEYIHFV
ncbi:MAG: UpxY family transcription antiterminator [Muribaculaceae bacterium]|nr:UpxY family transcription antiterminator [Muribaculaceae bacterium]